MIHIGARLPNAALDTLKLVGVDIDFDELARTCSKPRATEFGHALLLGDHGKAGRVYREADEEDTTLGTVVDDLLTGQFNNPVRVVAFNTSEGWSRDVSEDVAREVVTMCTVTSKMGHYPWGRGL